ncbi:MAG: DUF507 family protein [Nitrospirae bacterium]|nr:DUF507 family protein [Nitrospirota bacterium]MBI3353184.1 DUF507 family protein [Nitrospirota bacterium]
MRLTKNQISMMAKNMVEHLLHQKMIKPLVEKEKLIALIENTITGDFMVEEQLNQEVRELMKNYSEQIEKGEVDYNRLFQMIKQKLAKERGLVL